MDKAASRIRLPLLVENGAAATLKTEKDDSRKLYNRFFVCNDFLLYVRYLHPA